MLPAQFPDRNTPIRLFQKPNNLFIRKSLLHVRSPLEKRTLLDSKWPVLWGAHQSGTSNCTATVYRARMASQGRVRRVAGIQRNDLDGDFIGEHYHPLCYLLPRRSADRRSRAIRRFSSLGDLSRERDRLLGICYAWRKYQKYNGHWRVILYLGQPTSKSPYS